MAWRKSRRHGENEKRKQCNNNSEKESQWRHGNDIVMAKAWNHQLACMANGQCSVAYQWQLNNANGVAWRAMASMAVKGSENINGVQWQWQSGQRIVSVNVASSLGHLSAALAQWPAKISNGNVVMKKLSMTSMKILQWLCSNINKLMKEKENKYSMKESVMCNNGINNEAYQ